MPASRVRQHIASTHTSSMPQMVGDALNPNRDLQSRNQKYAEAVRRKRNLLNSSASEVGIANADEELTDGNQIAQEKESTLSSEVSLFGTWINDIALLELKHLLIFNSDNTGSLKSQGNVDGIGARRVNFTYTLSEDLNTISIRYLLISPQETNPFEIAKYVALKADTIDTTFTFQIKVFESTDGYSFVAPSGKHYEPFLALDFDASPWPDGLFATRTRYYGVLKRIPLAKKLRVGATINN